MGSVRDMSVCGISAGHECVSRISAVLECVWDQCGT